MRLPALVMTLTLLPAGWVSAQQVRLEFKDGTVTLRAENAPLRAVLAEWSKRGGTQIVNGDRVTGSPVTLELTNVPERQALDVLLRGVAGFMIGRREAAPVMTEGRSIFDRIHILPTAAPPRATASAPPAQPPRAPVALRPPVPADDVAVEPGIIDEDIPDESDPAAARVPPPLRTPPPQTLEGPDPDDAPEPGAATRGNPFGTITGTVRPGIITPRPNRDDLPADGRPNTNR